MKKILFLSVALLFGGMAISQKPDRSKAPLPGPAPKLQVGQYQLFTLENGLKVIVVENHKLPRVSYTITLDIAPVLEGDLAGYVGFAGELLKAGTSTRTKSQIDERVDFLGASLNTSETGVSGSCLTKHSESLLELMSDVLLHPSFPEDELEKVRKQAISGLASEKTDPNSISAKIGDMVKYGRNHPYGEFTSEASLNAITREHLFGYYKKHFKPNVAYLVIVGDITPEKGREQAEKYFGQWQRGDVPSASYSRPEAPSTNRVAFVSVPGAVQSVIDVTYPVDLRPGTQEAITASVLNNILGGSGFSTRLMQNLREDKAYTYGCYSDLSPDKWVGSFSAGCSVRNEVTDSAIVQILFEMQRLVDEPVADSTLTTVKNIMTGSFARSLERPQTVANFALNIERYQLPKDYYETYLQKLNAVTAADVQAAARKYLRPENAWIMVVGNRDVSNNLKAFSTDGKVEMYNADGSVFKELKPVPAGVTAQSVLDSYIAAIGGKKNLSKIKSVTQNASMAIGPMSANITMRSQENRRMSVVVNFSGMEVSRQVLNGDQMATWEMGQPGLVSDDDKREMAVQADLLAETRYADHGITPHLKGVDAMDGKEVYVIELRAGDRVVSTDYFDVTSGLRVRTVSVEEKNGKTVTSETTYTDYMTLKKGIRFPSKMTIVAEGQQLAMEVKEVLLNQKIDPSVFSTK